MFEIAFLATMLTMIWDDCPVPSDVGPPSSTVNHYTVSEDIDEAVGACTVPSKLWTIYYGEYAEEFWLGVGTSSGIHDPVCSHLTWLTFLQDANFSETTEFNIVSGGATVPAGYGYRLTQSISTTEGWQRYNYINSAKSILRMGTKVDLIDLTPIIYPMGSGSSGGS